MKNLIINPNLVTAENADYLAIVMSNELIDHVGGSKTYLEILDMIEVRMGMHEYDSESIETDVFVFMKERLFEKKDIKDKEFNKLYRVTSRL